MTTILTERYEAQAEELEEKAPAQANLLRYFLAQEEMVEITTITADLGMSVGNLRQLMDRLRDKGIELVCKRVHAPGNLNEDVRFVYGIRSLEVENYEILQKKKVMTAWNRMTKMFSRNIENLGLTDYEMGEIHGVMNSAKRLIDSVDFREISRKIEERDRREALARAEAEAAELRAQLEEEETTAAV
jgi:hypothetical protein